jgi:hypothetical protein
MISVIDSNLSMPDVIWFYLKKLHFIFHIQSFNLAPTFKRLHIFLHSLLNFPKLMLLYVIRLRGWDCDVVWCGR